MQYLEKSYRKKTSYNLLRPAKYFVPDCFLQFRLV